MCGSVIDTVTDVVEGGLDIVSDGISAVADPIQSVVEGGLDIVGDGIGAVGDVLGSVVGSVVPSPPALAPPPAADITDPILTGSTPLGKKGKKEGVKRTGLNDQSMAQANRKGAGRFATKLNIPQPSNNSLRI